MIEIFQNETIGDSLSSVNINYLTVENCVTTIKNDIDLYWNPMLDYYKTFGPFLKETSTLIQAVSSKIFSVCTTVETNSAGWIKPISVFYPSIFPYSIDNETIVDTLSSWINENFPVQSNDNNLNYIENQQIIVYSHVWQYGNSISENQSIRDRTFCQTQNKIVSITCTNYYSGYVSCDNGGFNCNGQSNSCQQTRTLECSYPSNPYSTSYILTPPLTQNINNYSNTPVVTKIPIKSRSGKIIKFLKKTLNKTVKYFSALKTGSTIQPLGKTVEAYIGANIEMDFQDRYENEKISTLFFKVKNCIWVLDKYI
jgi:hypothetical protein